MNLVMFVEELSTYLVEILGQIRRISLLLLERGMWIKIEIAVAKLKCQVLSEGCEQSF